MSLEPYQKSIIEMLKKHRVEYVIVGAYVLGPFGYERGKYDIDVWIDKHKDNAKKVYAALKELGVPFEISEDDFSKDNAVSQLGSDSDRIDILTDIDFVDFEDAYKNRIEYDFDGLKAYILMMIRW